jgi:ADP-ribose pyrophosphatase YjhB (NUDIX family)
MSDPKVVVWLLMEQGGTTLFTLRKTESRPFGGQWALPGDVMPDEESAAETVARVGSDHLDISVADFDFVHTLYMKDDGVDYAVNVFRVTAFEGNPRYRESGPYAEARWATLEDIPSLPEGLRALLKVETGNSGNQGARHAATDR